MTHEGPSMERDRVAGAAADDVLAVVEDAIAALENHPDQAVRAATRALLEGIDAVHRAGLTHLVDAIRAIAGEPFLNRLTGDPAIRLLLMSYNLIAVDRRLQAEEAVDTVRGHLHDHGIDVQIAEVVGGVVYVRIHQHRADPAPLEAIQRDVETALRTHLLGFQELVLRDREPRQDAQAFIPMATLRSLPRPVYQDVLAEDDLPPGGIRAVAVGDQPVLLARIDADVVAVHNRCGDTPLPLEYSRLAGAELTCSWHGCRYDLRTGHRVDGQPGRLQVYPVSVEDGRVRVAMAAQPARGPA